MNTGNQILFFVFDGKAIGSNGVDGPYFVKGLTMYGPSNANLVVIDMAETSSYKADEFGGYIKPVEPVDPVEPVEPKIGDLNGDNCVDRADYDLIMTFVRNRGPYNPVYDLNGDGAVDISDARFLVTHFTNPLGASCP